MNPAGRLEIVKEFVTDRSGIMEFAREVIEWCAIEFPGAEYLDISDPAGHNEFSDPRGGLTSNAKMVEIEHGVRMKKGTQAFQIRRESLGGRMNRRAAGGPAFWIYIPGCPRLVTGMEGGYCYRKLPNGEYSPDPDKNKYSHPVESLQYLSTGIDDKDDALDKDVQRLINSQQGSSQQTWM